MRSKGRIVFVRACVCWWRGEGKGIKEEGVGERELRKIFKALGVICIHKVNDSNLCYFNFNSVSATK